MRFAIIIGAMRSGTTSLYKYLSEHPSVCPCRVKEPEYFTSSFDHVQSRRVKNVSRYEELWEHFREGKHTYCLEASTGYTKYPFKTGVPKSIKEYGIKPKFIYAVRDPIERIRSQYNFELTIEGKSPESFDDPRLIKVSKYYSQLSIYKKCFGSNIDLLIVDFDNIVSKPEKTIERCFRFLGIDSEFVPSGLGRKVNATRSTLVDRLLGKVRSSWFAKSLLSGKRRAAAQWITRSILPYLRSVSPDLKMHEIKEPTKSTLREKIRKDMHKFKNEFGFPVGKWGF